MARLPNQGSDKGVWGTILNDFLLTAHAADGTVKPGSISTTQLTSDVQTKINTVTNTSQLSGVVVEVLGAYTARPTGFANVRFIGASDPGSIAFDGDEWIKLS